MINSRFKPGQITAWYRPNHGSLQQKKFMNQIYPLVQQLLEIYLSGSSNDVRCSYKLSIRRNFDTTWKL